jgi:hypothetical protein
MKWFCGSVDNASADDRNSMETDKDCTFSALFCFLFNARQQKKPNENNKREARKISNTEI